MSLYTRFSMRGNKMLNFFLNRFFNIALVLSFGLYASQGKCQSWTTLRDSVDSIVLQGKNNEAYQLAKKMLQLAEQMPEQAPEKDSCLLISLMVTGITSTQVAVTNSPMAASQLEKAIAMMKPEYETKLWGAEVYSAAGYAQFNLGNQEKADKYSQKAIGLFEAQQQTQNIGYLQAKRTYANLLTTSRLEENLLKARKIFLDLRSQAKRLYGRKSIHYITWLGSAGFNYTLLSSIDSTFRSEADSVWTAALALAHEVGNQEILCTTMLDVGSYYMSNQNKDKAQQLFEEGVALAKKINSRKNYLLGMYNLVAFGHYYGDPSQRNVLAGYCDELLAMPELKVYAHFYGLVAFMSVETYRVVGRLEDAEKLALEALPLLEKQAGTRYNNYSGTLLLSLANVYDQKNDLRNAILYIDEALEVYEKTGTLNQSGFAEFHTTIGDIYSTIDEQKSQYHIRMARKGMEQRPNYLTSQGYLSNLTSELYSFERAGKTAESVQLLDSIQRWYASLQIEEIPDFHEFARPAINMYHQSGRPKDAERIVQLLLKQINEQSATFRDNALRAIGNHYFYLKEYKKAIDYFSKALQGTSLLNNNSLYENSYARTCMAFCHFNLGERIQGLRVLQDILKRFKNNTQQNLWYLGEKQREFFLSRYELDEIYTIAFLSAKPVQEELAFAYDYRLFRQGLLLNTNRTVAQIAQNQPDTSVTKNVKQLLAIRAKLAQLSFRPNDYISMDSLEQIAVNLERKLGGFTQTLAKANRTVNWQAVQKALKPGEAALEIIRFTEWDLRTFPDQTDSIRYAALILRPEWPMPRLVPLPNGKDLETRWLQSYRDNLTKAQPSGEIYRQFWQSIAAALKEVKRAYIAPDGVYHLVSLPTLYNSITGRFLADEIDLLIVGSTREIINQPAVTTPATATLFGFPSYRAHLGAVATAPLQKRQRSGMSFEPLPATETEVNTLEKLFKTVSITPTIKKGEEATETALNQVNNPGILHIATHGFFRDTLVKGYQISPLLACGLALAGAADTTRKNSSESDDGILTGYEASLLNLYKTDLVTLSACDTGLGNVKAGEGVFGLQRAFLNSGAKAVLMSLWKLNDDLMLEFMTHFYKNWLSGLSKPQALRKAQTLMRQQYPEPYYWGNFVLLGK